MTRKQRDKYSNQVIRGKLALVDLAGRSAQYFILSSSFPA